MFKYFQKCIFCFDHLPDVPSGDGEHVIPKNIYGFWRVYDVCDNCREYFGDNIDQLSIQNPWIMKALQELKLPEFEKYGESLPFKGKDTIGGYSVNMVRRDKKFKNKVRKYEDQFFECSEEDWKNIGIKWLKAGLNNKIDNSLVKNEISRLEKEYENIAPGETVESKILGYTIRKRQVKGVKLDNDKLPSITPLIAKIASFFLVYFLPPNILSNLFEIDSLVDHSRHNKETRKYFINWCPVFREEKYTKIHAIRMHSFESTIVLDISLFGYPNWRIMLHCSEKIKFQSFEGIDYDTLNFLMDFRNPDNKEKIIGIKPIDTEEYLYFNIQA